MWTMTIAWGVAPWMSARVTDEVGRMVDRALALDDHPVAAFLALLDEPLDGALGEVADQPVDGDAPALDHHPGLAGRHERRRGAVTPGGRDQLERDRHLADGAIRPDGQDHPLPGHVAPPHGRLHPVGWPAVVDQPRAGAPPPRRRTPGRRRGTGAARNGRPVPRGSPRGWSSASRPGDARRSARCRSAARRGARGRGTSPRAWRRTGMSKPGMTSLRFRPAIVESRIARISSRP